MAEESRPKFARIWRGRTVPAKADEYQRYWLSVGIEPLMKKGALRVEMMREDRMAETEFMTVSYWASVEAMTGGSGEDPTKAHHLPRDAELLIELPATVQILRILEAR